MLPDTATNNFRFLAAEYVEAAIDFPHLKAITLAQWALESGWGTARLAAQYFNYAGMKWRPYMNSFATPIMYAAHDGKEKYCHFLSNRHFIDGFWFRLDCEPAYKGWRNHTSTAEQFIEFVGPIWVDGLDGTRYAVQRAYFQDVKKICALRTQDIFDPPSEE